MSLTKVTYSIINGAPVNVKDFGAVGNGVANDTAALQAAIDFAATNGQTLYFPYGTYLITSTLDIRNKKISWVGDNYYTNATTIQGNFDAFLVNGAGVAPSTYYGPYEIKNIRFVNTNNGTSLGSAGCFDLRYTGTCKIENCAVIAQNVGIRLEETISATFTDNYVQGDSGTNPNHSYSRGYYGQGRNTRVNGGRVYGCYLAFDISGDSWVVSQCNMEFNDIVVRTNSLASGLFSGCHIETSNMVWTNAQNLPTTGAAPWTDPSGDGTGFTGAVTFENCIFFIAGLTVNNGIRAPAFVCKSQVGFVAALTISGCALAIADNLATISNSFNYTDPKVMVSGLRVAIINSTGFVDPSSIPQDQYSQYIRTDNGKYFGVTKIGFNDPAAYIQDTEFAGYTTAGLKSVFYNRSVSSNGNDFSPTVNNVYSLGNNTNRWSQVFAVNGTINTSDVNAKTEIAPTSLGLNFINLLQPKQFKMKESGRWTDGELVDMVDENGNVIVDRDGKKIKVVKPGSQQPIPGQRIHQGLIAQEVKAALDQLGIDSAIWINGGDGVQGLRYEELIAPLIKAVQELSVRVQTLENK
ncbi:MAG: hypothetical protein EBZ61_09805 [Micrococcales bacterium]|nr:hypothetical protein [Micrococcales bacterium]